MSPITPCQRCRFPNAPTNAFCAQCGARMQMPATAGSSGLPSWVKLFLILAGTLVVGFFGIVTLAVISPQSVAPPPSAALNAPAQAVKSEPSPMGTPKPSMEVMLATIDSSGPVDEDDILVKRFRFLLENIQRKTKNTKDQIGDMTVNGQKLLRDKYGKEKTLLELMEGANKAMPESSQMRWDYAEIITALVILEGKS